MKLLLLGLLPIIAYGFDCPSDTGLFRDPEECSKYYQCWSGRAVHKSCPGGLVVRTFTFYVNPSKINLTDMTVKLTAIENIHTSLLDI